MIARMARVEDAASIVGLARLMFESMGMDASSSEWQDAGVSHVMSRLGVDLAVFVVDHPSGSGLVASAAGTVSRRLPGPQNPSAMTGYIQWVATAVDFRRQGLGRLTMQGLLDWYAARGVGSLELHATPEGEPLYRSLGFGESGGRALRRLAWALPPSPG